MAVSVACTAQNGMNTEINIQRVVGHFPMGDQWTRKEAGKAYLGFIFIPGIDNERR
jgi:hypothetical protein